MSERYASATWCWGVDPRTQFNTLDFSSPSLFTQTLKSQGRCVGCEFDLTWVEVFVVQGEAKPVGMRHSSILKREGVGAGRSEGPLRTQPPVLSEPHATFLLNRDFPRADFVFRPGLGKREKRDVRR